MFALIVLGSLRFIVLCCTIVQCCFIVFVCTRVGLLPLGANPIAVYNNNNNNNNDNSMTPANLTQVLHGFPQYFPSHTTIKPRLECSFLSESLQIAIQPTI
jgi:hypothetical protein